MSQFIIYPAIDLRTGKDVRLRQGDPERQKTYNHDPAATADNWIDDGASWLHVVNLDGAFGDNTRKNLSALEQILAAANNKAKVQFGGGIREFENIEKALNAGVNRVILGTAAIQNPDFAVQAIKTFGADQIVLGLDAQNGKLMTHGWQQASDKNVLSFAEELVNQGAKTIIYTNIAKDGMGTGVDWQQTSQIAQKTGVEVIASGGVSDLEDVRRVKDAGLQGLIIGRALYENEINLKEALAC